MVDTEGQVPCVLTLIFIHETRQENMRKEKELLWG